MQQAIPDDSSPAADAATFANSPDRAGDGGPQPTATHDGTPTTARTAAARVRRPKLDVSFLGADRATLEAFMDDSEARALIKESYRTKKPWRPELIIAALQHVQLSGRRAQEKEQEHAHQLASLQEQLLAAQAAAKAGAESTAAAEQAALDAADAARKAVAAAETAAVQAVLNLPSAEEQRELRRTTAQRAEVAAEQQRATEAAVDAAAAEQRAEEAEAQLKRAQVELDEKRAALKAAPSRTQARHEAEEARRRADAAADERTAQLERECLLLREGGAKALELITGLESQLRSEQTRRGLAVAELESAQLKLVKVEAPQHDTTLRNQELREAAQWRELDAARAQVAELQTRVQQLAAMPLGKRGQEPSQAARPLQQVRTRDAADAPFSARSLEYMCRLVDESNGSFEGAATANALVLGMHYGADVPDSMLYSAGTLRNAFHRVGIAAQEADATRNRADRGPWCIAQDAGGGTLMVATGHWDAEVQRPEARPLAASDLFRDQGARNGINTLERAAERGGLNFGRCVGSCSDGTEHAVQESQGCCELTHERAKTEAGPDGRRAAARGRPLAQADFCCIHGKALEENGGMQAAFPDNHLVDALRLLWELVRGPEGRPSQYRKIWAEQVARADGTILPALPVAFFDQNLKALTEPTEAKWQVMFDACYCLSPLLEPFGDVLQISARRCYLEIFFEKCLTLFCGSTDQEKAKRVTHPHILKLQLLHGIFGKPEVYTAINLTIDAWEQNYQAFHSFARSPSAYGGFAPPFLRHMMAEQAAKDVVWYRAARARPREHLPKTYRFITSSRWRDHAEMMTAGVRSGLEARAAAFLEAAEAKCLKWNGSSRSWLRARYLFGILCVESRRRW